MKTRIVSFFSGIFVTLIACSLIVSALAISGKMTIEVYPINIQIDNEVFQPKDANGNDVPVFTYNGTTYAPLRALAEAYGLEVGYDSKNNIAYVFNPNTNKPQSSQPITSDEQYSKFADLWKVSITNGSRVTMIKAIYQGDLSVNEVSELLSNNLALAEQFFLANNSVSPQTSIEYICGDTVLARGFITGARIDYLAITDD